MAKYKEFDRGKYQDRFDQMFGAGSYDRGMQSARETGRLKVEASLARKAFEQQQKEREKRLKEEQKAREKAKATELPKAAEGRKKPEKDGDGVLDKLVSGAKGFVDGVNRAQARAIDTLTMNHFSNKSKAEERETGKPKYEYFDERQGVGKAVDVLSDLSGYALGGIGATAGLRALGATGKGVQALSAAHKAGTTTGKVLARGAASAAGEGALIGGGFAGLESLNRLAYGNSEGVKKELGNVVKGAALGAAIDPIMTAGMPALKYASRNVVDNAIVNQGAEALGQAVRRAEVSPQSISDSSLLQTLQNSPSTSQGSERALRLLADGQVNAKRTSDMFQINNSQATAARNVMQDISQNAGRKPRGVEAEENLMELITRSRQKGLASETNRAVPSIENTKLDASDSAAIELELNNLKQERLAYNQLDMSDKFVAREARELDSMIEELELRLRGVSEEDYIEMMVDRIRKAGEQARVRGEADRAKDLASTTSQNPLDDLVPNREPVRPPAAPPEADVNKSFIDRTVKKPKKDSRTTLTKAQQQFTNDTAPLRQIDEQMKQLDADGMLEYLNPKTWIKSRTKSLATNSSLEKGMLNAKGAHSVAANHTTSRFSPLLENINKSKSTNVKELGDYAFAKHGMSLLEDSADARALRDTLLEEIDSLKASLGVDSDEVRAMQEMLDGYKNYTMPEGATYDVLQSQIAKFEQNPELVKHYDEFMKLQQENLKDMYEGGMITDSLYRKLKDNKTYISMHRNFDEISNTAGMASRRPQNTLERMGTGSEALIKDPVTEAMRNAYMTKFNIEKNNALQVVEKFAAIDKDNIMFKGVKEPNANTITVFKDGKPKHYEVPPELKAYVDNFNPNIDPDVLSNTLQKVAQMQRKLTTQYNISFQLKSLVREPVQAIMTSRTAKTSVHAAKNTALGYVDALVGPQLQNLTKDLPEHLRFNSYKAKWDELGGTGFQYIRMSDDDLQRVAKEMLESGTAKGNVKKLNPFRTIGKFGEKVEEGARLGEFRSAKGQGYSDADAFFEATDITNYKRSGTATQTANKYMPFLNATIQGNSRVLRAFQEAPARTLTRGATMLSTASLGAYSMRFADGVSDGQRQELDNLSQWEKDSYLHVPVPNSETIIAIPKAFAVGQMFMNPVERALDDYYNAVMKEESVPDHVKEGIKSTFRSFIPPYEVAGITTGYELLQNKSLFTGQEIESEFDREAGVPKKDIEAYNQSFLTNAISDLLNKMTFDSDSEGIVSPAQVDYFIKDITGTTGTQALGIIDSLVSEKAPTRTLSDQLLKPIKQFEADPTRASGVYAELQKLATKEQRANSSMTGMTEDEKNTERASRPLQNYVSDFKEINKEIQVVRSSLELTSQEKKELITELRKQQDALGTQAINWYNSIR